MQLKKKEEFKPEYKDKPKEYKKAPPVDWSTHEIDYSAKIPFGKYAGSIVRSVMNNDDWYWDWMMANNIFAEWALVKEKKGFASPKTKNKHYDPFVSSQGEVWLCIYEVPVKKSNM